MGAALNAAAASGAYVMSDRGTWISFKNKADLVLAVEGDKLLFNQYGVILVNPAKHPHVKKELGQQFIDWLISDEARRQSPITRLTASTGMSASSGSCRKAANTDQPSRSGIMTSSVIAVGRKSLASLSPSTPPAAVATENPSALR